MERLPTPVFWAREFHGLPSSPRGPKELDMTELTGWLRTLWKMDMPCGSERFWCSWNPLSTKVVKVRATQRLLLAEYRPLASSLKDANGAHVLSVSEWVWNSILLGVTFSRFLGEPSLCSNPCSPQRRKNTALLLGVLRWQLVALRQLCTQWVIA